MAGLYIGGTKSHKALLEQKLATEKAFESDEIRLAKSLQRDIVCEDSA